MLLNKNTNRKKFYYSDSSTTVKAYTSINKLLNDGLIKDTAECIKVAKYFKTKVGEKKERAPYINNDLHFKIEYRF